MIFYELDLACQLTSIDMVIHVLVKRNNSGIIFHSLLTNL
jgi:hypothetical protein